MNFTISKKVFIGFGLMVALIIIIGLVATGVFSKTKTFASETMTTAMDASDGSMETRINYLHLIWGTLEDVITAGAHTEASGRIDNAIEGFDETIELLDGSKVVPGGVDHIRKGFADLIDASTNLRQLSFKKGEYMEDLDKSLRPFIREAKTAGLSITQVDDMWSYVMAANDYAAYRDVDVKEEFEDLENKLKRTISGSGFLGSARNTLFEKGNLLIDVADEIYAFEEKFDEAAETIDEEMETIEEGGGSFVGTDANVGEKIEELESTMNSSMGVIVTMVVIGVIIAIILALLLARSIVTPITKTVERLKDLSEGEGDLTQTLNENSTDELGEMARYFNIFLHKLRTTISSVIMNSDQLASAANQFSATSTQLAKSAETQQDQARRVATAIEEMTSTAISVSKNSQEAAENAQDAASAAKTGGEVVKETIAIINHISEEVNNFASTVRDLGTSSDKIGEIVSVINDIADQTNLLALNAAIEAARAGEQGRGFAVVADEVRKLAERTGSATKEISSMIEGLQHDTGNVVTAMEASTENVDKGVSLANSAGDSLDKILTMSDNVGSMVAQIATAAEQQSAVAGEISNNVESFSRLSQENASGAEESMRSSEELAKTSEELSDVVKGFKV